MGGNRVGRYTARCKVRRTMTGPFELLAEARFRDWERRRQRGETSQTSTDEVGESMESQLLHRIVELLRQAACAGDRERRELERSARNLEIQLMISLEANGYPLAARRIAAELERIRGRSAR